MNLVAAGFEVADRRTAQRKVVVEHKAVGPAAADKLAGAACDERVIARAAVENPEAGAGFAV